MGRFDGKVAIVTGAGSGIGAATARRLALDGACVVVADLEPTRAERVAREIGAAGGTAMSQVTDVADEVSVRRMVRRAVDGFGRLDLLHNNAAATAASHVARDRLVADMDVALWDATMAVNLRGVMLGCKHAIPEMIKIGGGAIVNMSSVATRFGGGQDVAYGSSKAGVEALTRNVAAQCGRHRIRCNAVLPSITLTPAVLDSTPPEIMKLCEHGNCLPYFAEPEDVANVIAFLLSDEARHVTGQTIAVDGGFTVLSGAGAVADYARITGAVLPA